MFKKITGIFVITCMAMSLSSCSSNKGNKTSSSLSKIEITVSFNALKEFAEAIGKDKVEIKVMTPNGTEPHDYEPKARDLEALSTAQIFVYNGLGMESWVDKSLQAVQNEKLVEVDASKGFEPIRNTDTAEIKERGQYDPHIWLSLKGAENEAGNIKDALVKVDAANKDYYEKNYEDFSAKLEQLFEDYNKKFTGIANKNLVTGHAAFAYLCRDFGLMQNSVEDVFAEGEPSAKKLKELVDYCKENKIKTIFVEDMVSPKVSETLATEVGAATEKIYTLESQEDGKDYIQCMQDNLEKIYMSLK